MTPQVMREPSGALHGLFQRFMGMLLEQTAGKLPPWLAPEQVRVLACWRFAVRRGGCAGA